MQVSLNEAREDDEAENQNIEACGHFSNQFCHLNSQNQQPCGKYGKCETSKIIKSAETESGLVVVKGLGLGT